MIKLYDFYSDYCGGGGAKEIYVNLYSIGGGLGGGGSRCCMSIIRNGNVVKFFLKRPCCPVNFKKRSCRPVKFKKRTCR